MEPKHVHLLRRVRHKSGNEQFFCQTPDCNFKSKPQFLLGKRAICHRCGQVFEMNEYSIRLAKPHCQACHKVKEVKADITVNVAINPQIANAQAESLESLRDRLNLQVEQKEQEEKESDI